MARLRSTGPSKLPQSFVHSIAKQEFQRRCRKTMHAEHADSSELNELLGYAIDCAFTVFNTLGAGCTKMHCKDILAGEYFVDLLINDVLLVELKTVKALDDVHRMQCTNYLKATGLLLCLLLNFGKPRLEIKRVAHGL
jgi:hypothetical protein